MATFSTINLIRTKTNESPQLDAITASLRKSGYVSLVVFLCISLLVGVLYVLFSAEGRSLVSQRDEYTKRVSADQTAEGFFRSIKDRTSLVDKTMASKRPWSRLLDEISTFVSPPELTDINVDNNNKIIMTVNIGSIDTLLTLVNALIGQAQSGHLINPQLVSFQISKTGSVIASFSFSAMF